jgi:hypothetical protein
VQYKIIIIYLSISTYGSTNFFLDLGGFFSFLIFYTVDRTSWLRVQPVTRPLPAHRTAQTQNKCKKTLMPRVGLEPTIPALERTETVHASDGAASVFSKTALHCLISFPFRILSEKILYSALNLSVILWV